MFTGQLLQSESTAARRYVYMHLVDATDGMTPETGEASQQPQVSKNGGSWTNTTNTLVAIGNGRYYVELTATELNTLGNVQIRYKSAATAEAVASAQVVANDPFTVASVPTAAAIADAVWDEATSGHTTSGTFGEQLKTDVDAILADTNELQTDWVNGGRLDLLIDAIKAKTDLVSAAADIATAVWAYVAEGSLTAVKLLRAAASAAAGKLSGAATTTVTIRDVSDTKDRIVATVDADGNRTAITLDLT